MPWDEIKDFMLLTIVTLLAVIPLIREIILLKSFPKKSNKKKKPIAYIIYLGASVVLVLIFGWDKIIRDSKKDQTLETLDSNINYLKKKAERDSLYEQKVAKEYHIVRDSLGNPKFINSQDTYNTEVGDVEKLHIGPEYK
jgi:plasmid maintenance system killer protein